MSGTNTKIIGRLDLNRVLFRFKPYKRLYTRFLISLTKYYLVSFPKCGRTWIRVFLAKYFSELYNVPVDLGFTPLMRLHKDIPRIGFTHRGAFTEDIMRMRQDILNMRNQSIIFLVRDPRDVVVSFFFELTKRQMKTSVALRDFIRSKTNGIERIIEYMNFWLRCRENHESFILIKYEDCRKNTQKEFVKILNFLGIDEIDSSGLKTALDYSHFDNMKKMETDGNLLKARDPRDPESYKVRKGKIGGYKEYLSKDDIEYVEGKIKNLNKIFGYS